MNFFLPLHRSVFAGLAIFTSLASLLVGQSMLVVEHGDKAYQVANVTDVQPFVSIDGVLVAATGRRVGLQPVEEYAPLFISVRELVVNTREANVAQGGPYLTNELKFSAKLESSYRLENVFLALEMDNNTAGREVFPLEVGTLRPREPKPVSLNVTLANSPDDGRFRLHIFVGGQEAFNSEIPPAEREKKLDLMVAKRIKGQRDAMPRPFFGPAPEYPPHLLPTKARGEAVVAIHITSKGSVQDPMVRTATDPAFGEAAVAAIRQWRFLPLMKAGQAMETTVEMPFVFPVPKPASGKS
ncbi:MAG: TonB family protein [Opitutaceae bacterium]|nr:TonB family protein [Opitutaceae bacterium]